MVEGGAQVITSFIQEQHADYAVITLSPMFMGGVKVLQELEGSDFVQLDNVTYRLCGKDIVISGSLRW